MTTEEKDKQPVMVDPVQPPSQYELAMQEYENLPAFDYRKAHEEWKSGGKPILDALTSNYKKPERELTPEQEKKAKTASALTDSLVTLAEMFAHSQGANVRQRQGKSSTQTTNDRLQAIRDKYEQDQLRYDTGMRDATLRDFSEYLKQSMGAHGQKQDSILFKAKQAWSQEQAAAKAKTDAAKTEEAKRQFEIKQAETERSNKSRESIQRQNANTRSTAATTKEAVKNTFEIPVAAGTEGAEYDPYTGKYYVKQQIPPERQASILTNLPGGKQQYIINNKLYKVYNYKDDFGNMREQVTPFTDAEIIKHYIENDYQSQQPATSATSSGSLY